LISNECLSSGAFPGTKTYEVEAIVGEALQIMMRVANSLGKMILVESIGGLAILSHMGSERGKNQANAGIWLS
jgi:hypothetical protein